MRYIPTQQLTHEILNRLVDENLTLVRLLTQGKLVIDLAPSTFKVRVQPPESRGSLLLCLTEY